MTSKSRLRWIGVCGVVALITVTSLMPALSGREVAPTEPPYAQAAKGRAIEGRAPLPAPPGAAATSSIFLVTQDGDDFAAGTRMNDLAEKHGLLVALSDPAQGSKRIVLSAGGAMAAVMGAAYPDLYAAVGVHSGLPYRSAADLPSAFAAMRGDAGPLGLRSRKSCGAANDGPRIRTIVFHGDADNIVHPSNAASIVGAAKESESIERAEARHTASRAHTRTVTRDKTGKVVVEQWLIHGSGHAWSGGSRDGTYTDPQGPDASSEMLRFFLEARLELAGAK